MAKKRHYVDNKRLYATLVEYRDKRLAAEEAGDPRPPIPNYVGECLLQIATRLSYKPNFANYMFREEMVGISTTSIQRNQRILLHTLLRLSTMRS